MAWSDFETLFKATCKLSNEHYKQVVSASPNFLTMAAAITAAASVLDTDGQAEVAAALKSARGKLRSCWADYAKIMDIVLAYGGTQLTTPSRFVSGNKVTNRRMLLQDIRWDQHANSRSIAKREVTYAADVTADANGIVRRVPFDKNGYTIEAGLHGKSLDVVVSGNRSTGIGYYQSEVEIRPRDRGADMFDLKGPKGTLTLRAINDVNNGGGDTKNPNFKDCNSATHGTDVTSCAQWTLSNPSGSPTHKINTSIKWRSNQFGHDVYGASATRRFEQPLAASGNNQQSPNTRKIAVYKTGTPTGNIVLTWGSKSQTWTMASLSAGWNELLIDNDTDQFADNYDASGAVLRLDFQCTTGDASNYVTLGNLSSAIGTGYDGPAYVHFSASGYSQLQNTKTLGDTMTSAGKNATGLYLCYHDTEDRDVAWLVASGSPTTADYT